MTFPQISVIVPAKDASLTIRECIQGLLNQQGFAFERDYEVIVVDDGSQDETAKIAQEFHIRVISQENAGPASARNTGVDHAQGELVFFTDADCVPKQNWLQQMTKSFEDSDVIGVKGAYLCKETGLVPRFVQQEFEQKYQYLQKLSRIDFIDTYSAGYRKQIFLDNGGFDTRFSNPSVEDQELSFRLERKGYKLVFQPEARVYHHHDLNLREYFLRKWRIGYWKAIMLRWLPEKTIKDTYTPPSQRFQILFLAILLLSIALSPLNSNALWISGSALIIFLISAIPFLRLIRSNDKNVVLFSIPMLFVRAGALGFGLLHGILFPTNMEDKPRIGLNWIERFLKRSMDIISSVVGLILFSPALLLAGVLIKLDSPGKIIFSQDRIGEKGRPFRIYKLRSMVLDAQEKLPGVLLQNKVQFDQPVFKIHNDPRVTRVGRFLRRWSLDEIPQFWNILRGEMSLVGPRPEEDWVVAMYNDQQRQRLVVKPGLTGPMQVSGRGDLDFASRLAIELDYIQHYTLWLDLKIIFKTLRSVISGKGAY